MTDGKGQKVNRKQLAHTFGISLPTVDAWLRADCPFEQKGANGKEWIFDTAVVSRWRVQRAADEAAGTSTADEEALKRRRNLADTLTAEFDLKERMELVAPVEQMERHVSRALAQIKSNLRETLITRCVSQLLGETDKKAFKRIMLAEVDSVLEELAGLDPEIPGAEIPQVEIQTVDSHPQIETTLFRKALT
jgi:phage terminase Nu1 subunit (DNA packaging protein)